MAADPPVVPTPPGAGPRHLGFHPDRKRLDVINELDNPVGAHDFDAASGRLTPVGEPVPVKAPPSIAIVP